MSVIGGADGGQRGVGRREAHPATRFGSVLIGLVLIGIKVDAFVHVFHDGRLVAYIVFGLGALHAFRRGRPLALSFSLGVIVGVAVALHPWWHGVLVGGAAIAAMAAICLLIGAVLNLMDRTEPSFGGGWLG